MLGKFTTIPTELLLNNELSPIEKLVAITLAGNMDIKGNTTATVEDVTEVLKRKNDGKVMVPNKDSVQEVIDKVSKQLNTKVVDKQPSKRTPSKQDLVLESKVEEVMKFISEARLVRGYAVRPLSGDTHERAIRARIRDGATVEECKAFTVYKFQQDWYKSNPDTLVPSIMFNKTKYQRDVATLDLEEWKGSKVTQYGYEYEQEEAAVDKPLAEM